MDLQNFLIEALKERFKANAVVKELEKQIKEIAEQKTFEKYKDKPFFKDNMEFELLGVSASFWPYPVDTKVRQVHITLAYTCKSKLPKAKRDKLQQVKDNYEKNKRLEWNDYKIPIWHSLDYSVELQSVLDGNINLLIE